MRASSTAATLVACALALAALSGVALGKPIVGADGKTYLYEHARVPADEATPLDEYVAAEDTVFAWRETNYTLKGWGWTGHLLNLTSCAWLPEEEVGSASVWTHQLFVVVPDTIKDASTGTVWITGGDNGNPGNPKGLDEDVVVTQAIATGAGIIAASLYQIPNQPIMYQSEKPTPARRTEDAMIAYGWNQFIEGINAGMNVTEANPLWLARLPMTKSVVRAMDAVTAWAAQSETVKAAVQAGIASGANKRAAAGDLTALAAANAGPSQYMVAGASKRGWTTWTTAAVDKRVMAMAPVVMDALHVTHFMHQMWQSYGGWSFALKDYYALNITEKFDTPGHTALEAIVDPAAYIQRFTMPKMAVDATGDEFFMITDDAAWWDAMPEPKARMMIQNAEHSLATGVFEVLDGVVAWANAIVHQETVPHMNWTTSADGATITVTTDTAPSKVTMWSALTTRTNMRDFRLVNGLNPCPSKIVVKGICTNIYLCNSTNINATAPGSNEFVATAAVPGPNEGWRMHFMEVEFPSSDKSRPFIFTTQASIVPLTMPFPDCQGAGCRGTLV